MRLPTSVLAAAGLIAGYGVAVGSGSRPLGGLVLLLFAAPCVVIWARRHDRRLTAMLVGLGLAAFALSHVLGLLIGGWPAVVVTAAATAVVYWRVSDQRADQRETPRIAA